MLKFELRHYRRVESVDFEVASSLRVGMAELPRWRDIEDESHRTSSRIAATQIRAMAGKPSTWEVIVVVLAASVWCWWLAHAQL